MYWEREREQYNSHAFYYSVLQKTVLVNCNVSEIVMPPSCTEHKCFLNSNCLTQPSFMISYSELFQIHVQDGIFPWVEAKILKRGKTQQLWNRFAEMWNCLGSVIMEDLGVMITIRWGTRLYLSAGHCGRKSRWQWTSNMARQTLKDSILRKQHRHLVWIWYTLLSLLTKYCTTNIIPPSL